MNSLIQKRTRYAVEMNQLISFVDEKRRQMTAVSEDGCCCTERLIVAALNLLGLCELHFHILN